MNRILLLVLSVALFFGLGVTSGPRSGMNLPHQCGASGGGSGDEETLQCIYELKEFEGLPADAFKIQYYFSSYSGSDSNPGTKALPLQTLAKAKDVCLDGTRCTFFEGEVWSPLVLTMDENYGFQVGEGVDWNAGADVGIVIGVDPETKTLVLREVSGAGTDPVDADVIDTLDNRITNAGIDGNPTDTLGTGAADIIDPMCGAGEPCILYEGASYENPPIFDCNKTVPNGVGDAVFEVNTTDGGEAYIQNIIVQHCNMTGFSSEQSSGLIGLNLSALDTHNVDAGVDTANGFYSANSADFSCYNCEATGISDSSVGAQVGSAVNLTSTGDNTWISQKQIYVDASSDAASQYVISQRAGGVSVVGAYIHGTEGATKFLRTFGITATGGDTTTNLCRVTIDAGDLASSYGIQTQFANSKTATLSMCETSIVDGTIGLQFNDPPNDDDLTVYGRGVMIYNMDGAVLVSSGATGYQDINLDMEGIYEETLFNLGGQTGRTQAQAKVIYDAGGANWTLFENNSNDPAGADLPWENTGGSLTMPQQAIHPDCGAGTGICYNQTIGSYTCALAAAIPKEVLGTQADIENLTLDGTIGAR